MYHKLSIVTVTEDKWRRWERCDKSRNDFDVDGHSQLRITTDAKIEGVTSIAGTSSATLSGGDYKST